MTATEKTFTSDEQAAGYLAAIIDGEGCVAVRHRIPGRSIGRSVQISNTEPSIITATVEACERLGIECRVACTERTQSWKPIYRVTITGRANYQRLQERVTLRSELKAARLEYALSSYTVKPPRPSDADLRRWYCDEGWSAQQIADEIGRHIQTVYGWMVRAGIERRTKSEAQTNAWAVGRKRDWRSPTPEEARTSTT